MKQAKFLLVWMAIIAPFAGLFSQSANNIPPQLIDLIHKSLEHYPKLKEGNEYVKLGEAKTDLAYAGYMPVIGAEASYRYSKPTPEITIPIPGFESKIKFQPANNYDFNLKLTQPIWDFGRTQAAVNKSKQETNASRDNLENNKNQVAYQVTDLFCTIVFLTMSVDVQQQQIKLLQANEDLINNRIKNGDAIRFDLLSTQVRKNNAQNRLIDLQTNLHKQYDLMNMLTGSEGYAYVGSVDVNLDALSLPTVTPDNNFDVKLIQDKLTSASWDIKSAKAGWLPSLNLVAQAGYKNGFVPEIDKLTFNYGIGVGLSVPIFSSARPNYQTKIAQINLQANTYALEAQKMQLNKDIITTQNDITSTADKLKNYELQINQAEEAVTLANARYKEGVITNLELLTAQTNLLDAKLGKLQLQLYLLSYKLELNRLGGVRFW